MKNIIALILVLTLMAIACTKQGEEFKLTKDSPAYLLAQDLSATLPSLDPEADFVIVSTHRFNITAAQVMQAIQDNMGSQAAQLKGIDQNQLRDIITQNAERMAERKLLLTEAADAGTRIEPGDLESALSDQYTRVGGEEQFLQMLSQAGVSMEHVKENIETDLLIQAFLDSRLEELVEVTETEIQQAYETDNTASVRHILLLTQGKTDEEKIEVRKAMEGILNRARAGEDFAELAQQYTEDPGSKETGGLYEDFGRGRMVKPFEDAAFSVPVGEISDIVETQYGYHILKIVERKREERPFEEARGEIETQLRQEKQGNAVQEYIDRLKEDVGFEVHVL
jgi:parvulin-like peptidyl-prolyl isomerase